MEESFDERQAQQEQQEGDVAAAVDIASRGLIKQLEVGLPRFGIPPAISEPYPAGYFWGYCKATVDRVGSGEPRDAIDFAAIPVLKRVAVRVLGAPIGAGVSGRVGLDALDGNESDDFRRGRLDGEEEGAAWALSQTSGVTEDEGNKLRRFLRP